MAAQNYFRELGLDVEKIMALPEDEATAEVKRAHDGLINAINASGSVNPRVDLLNTAMGKLSNPDTRQHHAETLGYKKAEASPPPPPPRPRPEPRHWRPPEPRHRRSVPHEGGPWWLGGLLAMPAAILYIAAAGLTFERTPVNSVMDTAAVIVAGVTAYLVGVVWYKIVLIGPFFLGAVIWLTQLTAGGFVRDMASWNMAPEAGILAVLGTLGLGLGLTGQVRPTTDFTGEYLGTTTVRFFLTVLVLIPAIGLMMPTRETGGGGENPGTAESAPTAQTEQELNLTRNDWRDIQGGLEATGHYRGTVDGLDGPMTRTAITTWQRTQSGIATGYLNQTQADVLTALAPIAAPQPAGGGQERAAAEQPELEPEREPEPAAETVTAAGLVITAEPNSRIVLDDHEAGFTSENGILRIDGVGLGGHLLRAEKDGFDTVRTQIEVAEGVSQVVELLATALPGRLTVTTNAAAARVAIDRGDPSAAPVNEIEVESGRRLVTVSAPGYNTYEEYVEIAAGATTTHHATLEEASLDAEMAQLERLFADRRYAVAADMANMTARMLLSWREQGIDVRENLGRTLAIQGRALYATGSFAESIQPLYNAVQLGHEIELPIKHRHGGGGFRQGFCTGTLMYSLDEIAFRSIDDPDHGFAVEPQDISNIERAEAQGGVLSRLNTEVEGRGSMDFVHPNSEQRRRDPDSALVTDIVCRDCNQALAVHERLLQFLTRGTQ